MGYSSIEKLRAYNREYYRPRQKAKWDRYRAAGACGECGEPVERFSRCLRCRLRQTERLKK